MYVWKFQIASGKISEEFKPANMETVEEGKEPSPVTTEEVYEYIYNFFNNSHLIWFWIEKKRLKFKSTISQNLSPDNLIIKHQPFQEEKTTRTYLILYELHNAQVQVG